MPALVSVAVEHDHTMMKRLLDRGADSNEIGFGYGMTLLIFSALDADITAMQMLVDYGAGVNLHLNRGNQKALLSTLFGDWMQNPMLLMYNL
ncbi:hypothetical protein BJX63DRAFT_432541 [Aspergillus granulosus]|uniref:Ankyrin n=1 Tax=Aspergillus granulosus TaxID=176169 RepID=A0ABR4HCZ1_9EURO